MAPRGWLSLFVALLLGALAALALRGFYTATTVLALSVFASGVLLDLSYLIRRRKRRALVLSHRRTLDWIVRGQLLALGLIGSAIGVGFSAASLAPLAGASVLVAALIIGVVVALVALYVSSLVDWFWVLPVVSGLTGPPPCTRVGGKSFAPVTKVWYFHRVAATTIFTFVLATVPAYVAGTITNSGPERSALTLLGAALAIGFNAVNSGSVAAFKQFLGPRLLVGGYIRMRRSVEDFAPQDAYVVDVSIQGIKYKLENDCQGRFKDDGELLAISEVASVPRATEREKSICPSMRECRAANWYCIRNRNAHYDFAPDDQAPAPLPEGFTD